MRLPILVCVGRRQFVAPGRPALTLLAREQFEIRPWIQPTDAPVDLVRLLAVLADRSDDDLMHIGRQPQRVAAGREQANFGIGFCAR